MSASNSLPPPVLDTALCRFCRTMKKCRLLNYEYTFKGQKETYSDMIMDSFGLLLSYLDGAMTDRGVCATCVMRLRDACDLKAQVLRCEEMFLKERITLDIDSVKDEPIEDDNNDVITACDDAMQYDALEDVEVTSKDEHMDDGNNLPVNEETSEIILNTSTLEKKMIVKEKTENEDKKIEVKGKITMSELKKLGGDVTLMRRGGKLYFYKKRKVFKVTDVSSNGRQKLEKIASTPPDGGQKMASSVSSSDEPASPTKRYIHIDIDNRIETNLICLITNSYVTPFSSRFNSYNCFYCTEPYVHPEPLRTHTQGHDPKEFDNVFKKRIKPYKIDVTRIDCRLCDAKIDDLDTFRKHISGVHKKVYYKVKENFIKFKLTDSDIGCLICNQTFPFFDKLLRHSLKHYCNYICHVCGESFLTEKTLLLHIKNHSSNKKFMCEICGKLLSSESSKESHVNLIHSKRPTISCPQCDSLFLSHYERRTHMAQEHGITERFPCPHCDKVYYRSQSRSEHIRRVHNNVKRHPCKFCEEKFFTPAMLRDHLTTHTGEKNYRCDYCHKSYPRLKTLKQHIKIHTNDRRYKCDVCGSAFIQNVSLKCHMKSHHPDFVM